MRYTSFLKRTALSALFFAAVFPSAATAQTQWSVVDYYVYNNMPYTSVNGLWGGITHLAIGDFHVNSSGAVSYIFTPQNYFPTAISTAHANGAKALVILSDTSGSDNLAAAFASNPTALMSNIANVVNTYGFDGIQVDWEKSFPYSNTQATLGAFFQALRSKLGNSKVIMADAFAAGGPYGVVTQMQWNTAIGYLDRLSIMTYDYTYQVSGTYSWFNAPLYNGSTPDSQASSVDQSVSLFLGSGSAVPASKLMIGLPFYGYSYSNVNGPRQSTGSLGGQSNYSAFANKYNLASATFDSSAQVPWMAVSGGYISFDNAQSIKAKVNYAQNKGLGGWMTFNLSADYLPSQSQQHPLLAAIASAMGSATTAPTITSTSPLAAATVGTPYSLTVSASGTKPMTWAVTSGALPSGLSLNSSTGAIAGTPMTAGSSSFAVQASNAAGSTSAQFGLTVNPASGGTWYNFISVNSGQCLDVTGMSTAAGAKLEQWPCSGVNNENFQFAAVQGGYKITAQNSGLQLDINGNSTADGAAVIQWPYNGGKNEIWNFTQNTDGSYTLKVLSTGKCASVSGSSTTAGASVVQSTCNGGSTQKWKFVVAK